MKFIPRWPLSHVDRFVYRQEGLQCAAEDAATQTKNRRVQGRLPGPCHLPFGLWVNIEPPGYGTQALVHVSIYQGSVLGIYV